MQSVQNTVEPAKTTGTPMRLNITKDIIIIVLILAVSYLGYEAFKDNRERMKSFEMALTKMGTGISLDNQRKAKISKATEMILSRNKKLPQEVAMNYAELFVDEADKYTNFDFVLLISIASQESAFNSHANSETGAKGLMQVMPMTAMDMCEYLHMTYIDTMLYDPKYNIRIGTKYVNNLMSAFNNIEHVISGYNAGETGAKRYIAYRKGTGPKTSVAEENLKYVPAVLAFKAEYEKML